MRASRYILPLLLATSALAVFPAASFAQVACGPSVTTADAATTAPIAPPALPDYDQPPIPAPGYIWTPGYWGYADAGYYWVPGTWVQPPTDGLLWTPGYWAWNAGVYAWNAGYWGLTVGFYGGIDYGFGYGGVGYDGGYWDHGHFAYNRTVNNFGGVHITNVYNRTVINNDSRRISYNGGTGGLTARPTAQQEAYAHEHHLPPTREQTAHVDAARGDRSLLATENHRRPPIAATQRPGDLHSPGAVAARQAAHPNATAEGRPPQARPNEPAHTAAARPGTATPPEAHPAPRPQVHAAAQPAAPRPQVHAAAQPAAPRPQVHAAAQPAAPRPQVRAAAQPATPRPQVHAAAQPAAPRPQVHAAAQPATPRPQMHAAARPAAPRPQMHAAAQPAAPRPQVHAAARPAAPRPQMHAAARPPAPHPQMHAAAAHPAGRHVG